MTTEMEWCWLLHKSNGTTSIVRWNQAEAAIMKTDDYDEMALMTTEMEEYVNRSVEESGRSCSNEAMVTMK